jgi:hypothetical protein
MSLAVTEPLQTGLGQTGPVPILAEPFDTEQRKGSGDETPRANAASHTDEGVDGKKKKRSLFGFGKKKTDETSQTLKSPFEASESSTNNASPSGPPTRRTTASPINIDATHHMMPSSPGRNLSSSPRLVSPSGSQIFERDVTTSLVPNSPAIPSHYQTENYIPPVLDASSEAITDDHLDPDSVEIITHTSHQPAASGLSLHEPPTSSWADELASSFAERDFGLGVHHSGNADSASNYGNLDNNVDIRRLSFISFADVVQAEQGPGATGNHRDSMHLGGLTSIPSSSFTGLGAGNRSPSPIRSPVSSSASPPTSKSGSVKGLEMSPGLSPGLSPARKPLGSPTSAYHQIPSLGGELNVETMTQALRRTGSGDMGVHRSIPTSPVEGPSR